MNAITALARAEAARPVRLVQQSFAAWRVGSGDEAQPIDVTGDTLAAAVQSAAQSCQHKDTLLIRETRADGSQQLHSFAITRRSQPTYLRCPDTGASKRVHLLDAKTLFSVKIATFVPVEPWRWSVGADVIGVDRSVIEGRAA